MNQDTFPNSRKQSISDKCKLGDEYWSPQNGEESQNNILTLGAQIIRQRFLHLFGRISCFLFWDSSPFWGGQYSSPTLHFSETDCFRLFTNVFWFMGSRKLTSFQLLRVLRRASVQYLGRYNGAPISFASDFFIYFTRSF